MRDLIREQPGPDDYEDDDVPPPPPHQHWLRGEQKPRNFELFKQVAPPPVSRQSSSAIPPTRQPSQTFPPPPSRQPSFAPPTRQASFARNNDAQIINFSDADFAASASLHRRLGEEGGDQERIRCQLLLSLLTLLPHPLQRGEGKVSHPMQQQLN